MTSGTRNPPPISTSSPLDTITSRPAELRGEPRESDRFDAPDDGAVGRERRVAVRDRVADRCRRGAQGVEGGVAAEALLERADCRTLAQLLDRWDGPEIRHCRVAD